MKSTTLSLWVLLLLFGLPLRAFATIIVAILEEKSIRIAVDGVTTGKSKKTGNPVNYPVCKIRCFDRLCFAAAGRYTAKTIGFNGVPVGG